MASPKQTVVAALSVLALSACNSTTNSDYDKTQSGAVIGAMLGAASQILAGNSESSVVKGAVIGGFTGAAVGNVLDKQEAELRTDLSGSGATITNTGKELVVTLPEGITFETNSSKVRQSLQDDLRALAANLQEYPQSSIDVVGHTDNVGTENYNRSLSSRRAQSVTDILLKNGVPYPRIKAYGRGETEPATSNETKGGRAANRRVEVVIQPIG